MYQYAKYKCNYVFLSEGFCSCISRFTGEHNVW